MEFRELIRRKASDLQRSVFGPGVSDRDFPDRRPVNPSRDQMEAAKVVPKLTSKDKAIAQIREATIGVWSDYKYRENYHDIVRQTACRIAKERGASDEEIRQAIHDGNLEGATARQGFDDYWRN